MADREKITQEKMQQLFRDLEEHGNFEVRRDGDVCLAAYMMNDAVEDYLILTEAEVIGELPEGGGKIERIEAVEEARRPGLRIRMKDGTFCTVWYKECFRSLQCYDQSRLMHCWVDGEEHMRRLVYQVATMNDKAKYHPDRDIANEKERELAKLMQFRPFYFWSPIASSIGVYYGESKEGIEAFRKIAEEAGDRKMLRQIRRYRFSSWLFGPRTAMAVLESEPCYRLLVQKIREASQQYPRRSYGEEEDTRIDRERERIGHAFRSAGYGGQWPRFEKNGVAVEVFEEEPFTVLEAEDFPFIFKFMAEKKIGRHVNRAVTEDLSQALQAADD